jgi:hypothetical protein
LFSPHCLVISISPSFESLTISCAVDGHSIVNREGIKEMAGLNQTSKVNIINLSRLIVGSTNTAQEGLSIHETWEAEN